MYVSTGYVWKDSGAFRETDLNKLNVYVIMIKKKLCNKYVVRCFFSLRCGLKMEFLSDDDTVTARTTNGLRQNLRVKRRWGCSWTSVRWTITEIRNGHPAICSLLTGYVMLSTTNLRSSPRLSDSLYQGLQCFPLGVAFTTC